MGARCGLANSSSLGGLLGGWCVARDFGCGGTGEVVAPPLPPAGLTPRAGLSCRMRTVKAVHRTTHHSSVESSRFRAVLLLPLRFMFRIAFYYATFTLTKLYKIPPKRKHFIICSEILQHAAREKRCSTGNANQSDDFLLHLVAFFYLLAATRPAALYTPSNTPTTEQMPLRTVSLPFPQTVHTPGDPQW
jgi:hypothetical protein